MERIMHPESRSMSEIVGGIDNVFYSWDFFGNPKYPNSGIITKKGGGDFTHAEDEDCIFVYRNEKWWAIDLLSIDRPTRQPSLIRKAREEELESIDAFIKEAIHCKS